jgi:hypothetical protein
VSVEPGAVDPYRLDAAAAAREWLETVNPTVEEKRLVREFLVALTTEPVPPGTFVNQGTGLPNYSQIVPNTDTQVVWVVIKSPPYVVQNRSVKIMLIKRAPVD